MNQRKYTVALVPVSYTHLELEGAVFDGGSTEEFEEGDVGVDVAHEEVDCAHGNADGVGGLELGGGGDGAG